MTMNGSHIVKFVATNALAAMLKWWPMNALVEMLRTCPPLQMYLNLPRTRLLGEYNAVINFLELFVGSFWVPFWATGKPVPTFPCLCDALWGT